jgi:hypothetical protein
MKEIIEISNQLTIYKLMGEELLAKVYKMRLDYLIKNKLGK